jgi:hypothetical protein
VFKFIKALLASKADSSDIENVQAVSLPLFMRMAASRILAECQEEFRKDVEEVRKKEAA